MRREVLVGDAAGLDGDVFPARADAADVAPGEGDEAVLGEPGKGFPVLGSALDTGRFSVAARQVGQAQHKGNCQNGAAEEAGQAGKNDGGILRDRMG